MLANNKYRVQGLKRPLYFRRGDRLQTSTIKTTATTSATKDPVILNDITLRRFQITQGNIICGYSEGHIIFTRVECTESRRNFALNE